MGSPVLSCVPGHIVLCQVVRYRQRNGADLGESAVYLRRVKTVLVLVLYTPGVDDGWPHQKLLYYLMDEGHAAIGNANKLPADTVEPARDIELAPLLDLLPADIARPDRQGAVHFV